MGRYLAGLCVTALGVCAGGWLVLTPFAFGYPGHGRAALTALATGGGLAAVCAAALAWQAISWRRALRADGVLPPRPARRSRRSARRQARAERLVRASRQRELAAAPDPAQVLTDLRALLTPLLADGGIELLPAAPVPAAPVPAAAEIAGSGRQVQAPGHLRGTRPASLFAEPEEEEPLLSGAELLMVGSGEEEAW